MLKTSKLLGRSLKLMSTGTAQAKIPESQKDTYYKTKEELSRIQHGKPEGWDQAKPFEQIPGPKPIPLLGNFWRFLPGIGEYSGVDAQELQFRLLQDYGDLVCLRGLPGRPPIVFLYNVKEMEILFKNEGVWPVRKSGDAAKYYREVLRNERFKGIPNLAVMNGEDWHNYRTLVNPVLMQPKVMKQYAPRLDPIASEFVDNMRIFAKQNPHKEMPADFINFINKMTLEAITLVAIDKRLGAMDPNLDKNSDIQKFINSVQDFFAILFKLEFLPSFWKIYPTKDFKRFVELLDFTADFVTKLIKEQAGKIKTEGPKNQQDMSVFEKLISVNENIAIAMSMDMIQAGVDSTSKQLSSILYYLAKNKEPQEKLRQELVRLLPQKDTQISSEILDQAQYLRAVIKETMRIAGAAAGSFRTVPKDLVLCGYRIPKGTDILTGNWTISAKSDKHFKRGSEFIPERWLRSNNDELSYKNVNPFVLLPFGFGPRSCIGRRFANLEMEVVVAKVIRNFVLDWPHADARFSSSLFYGIADPLRIKIEEVPN